MVGAVASDSTCWRVLAAVTDAELGAVAAARAAAGEVAWAQRAEITGTVLPASRVAGAPLLAGHSRPVLIIDQDATSTFSPSEKVARGRHVSRGTWGFHPVVAFCANTNEALTGLLRAGNAGSNTAADHISVIDAAVTQIPDEHRHGNPILFRLDGADASTALLAHTCAACADRA